MLPVGQTSTNEGIVGLLRAFGGDLFDADGKKCLLNTPESIAGAQGDGRVSTRPARPSRGRPDIEDQRPELFQGQKVGIVDPDQLRRLGLAGPDRQAAEPVRDGRHPEPARPDRQARHPGVVRRQGRLRRRPRTRTRRGSSCRSSTPASGTASSASPTASAARAAATTSGTATSSARRRPKLQQHRQGAGAAAGARDGRLAPPGQRPLRRAEPILLNEFVKVTLGQMTVEQYAEQVQADPGDPGQARACSAERGPERMATRTSHRLRSRGPSGSRPPGRHVAAARRDRCGPMSSWRPGSSA